jgi:Flp pilus assembly protein TadG
VKPTPRSGPDRARPGSGRDESGAVMVIVAVLLPVLFAFGAVAVSYALLMLQRTALYTATDAAVLAAAGAYADAPGTQSAKNAAAQAACELLIAENNASPVRVAGQCAVPKVVGGKPYLTVTAQATPRLPFAPTGDRITVQTVSMAAVAPPASVYGIRPWGVCRNMQGWRAEDNEETSPAIDVVSAFLGDRNEAQVYAINPNSSCPTVISSPTAYGLMESTFGSTGTGVTKEFISSGNSKAVALCTQHRIETNLTESTAKDTAKILFDKNTAKVPYTEFLADAPVFPIVVWGSKDACGSTSSSHPTVVGYLGMRIHGLDQTGASDKTRWWVSFAEVQVDGTCCDASPNPPNTAVIVRLCDPDTGCATS